MKSIATGIAFYVWPLFLLLRLQPGSGQYLDPDCGIRAPSIRIFNGSVAGINSSPWMVFVHSDTERFVCGGTLITHRMVLTAAHCFIANLTLVARLGEYQRTKYSRCYNTTMKTHYCTDRDEVPVDLGIKHSRYNPITQDNDIAILRLARYIAYKDNIRPICIVMRKDWRNFIDSFQVLTATGWGTDESGSDSDYLRTLEIHRQPRNVCNKVTNSVLVTNQFCAGNNNSNLCFGDSGGPVGKLVNSWDKTKRFMQVGIASYTNTNCLRASVFTDVLSHVDWIRKAVELFGS
ncbi:hypothetical protein KR059_007332, partial [Drosophila kikkawai]